MDEILQHTTQTKSALEMDRRRHFRSVEPRSGRIRMSAIRDERKHANNLSKTRLTDKT
jgi:hypothetical protein